METLAFWALVLLFWLYFELTTANQREQWFYNFLLATALVGAVGFVWDTISKWVANL